MPKTILKLYENGNFETVDAPLVQSEIVGNYSFNENSITVPKIIEYPPANYRNYFIEKTSEPGFIDGSGYVQASHEHDRVSDYIDISDWEYSMTIVRFNGMTGDYRAWVCISHFDENKNWIWDTHDEYHSLEGQTGDIVVRIDSLADVSFMRVSVNYYDNPITDVKISVEKDTEGTDKHYLAPEDLPEWVVDTGQPISIFKEGIVIKGNLIQSNS